MKEQHKKVLLSSWGGAIYLDRWMGVHFLAGVVLGFVFRLSDVAFATSMVIIGIILVAWEVFEWGMSIYEPWQNTLLDIVVGLVGAGLVLFVIPSFSFGTDMTIGGVLLLLYIVISILGWRAWCKRKHAHMM